MERLSIETDRRIRTLGTSLRSQGTWEQMCQYFVHHALYHLREGDPCLGPSPADRAGQAAFVAVEFDEFGGGHEDQVHQRLFADLGMLAAGLEANYLGYIGACRTPCRGA